ncbi:hypothetical protein EVAR_72623_1 [Eumeta japonica]|uniref:Uncharacterized protein n=1 Tax=Eumeta variegata TaxID=151549 RepID=A0A4C2AC09_EUMVA|nr:hypothetical protein EVAR_72623_1 [Eumeta japonica]
MHLPVMRTGEARPSGSNTDMTALVTCRFVGGSDVSNTSVGVFRRPRLKPRASLLMSHCRPRVFQFVSPRVVHCRHFACRAFHSRLQFRYSPNRVTRRLPFDESHKLVSKHAWLPLYC